MDYLNTAQARRIAYEKTDGAGPCVVFLSGLKSDMDGTKAVHLEQWAKARGHAFLRFDYSGHGKSSGAFTDGCIGDWAEDTAAILSAVTDGPLVLVGSSMGGWQSLWRFAPCRSGLWDWSQSLLRRNFTEDSMWANFTQPQRAQLMDEGQVALPSDYGEPYIITKRMIEDGRNQLVLRDALHLPCPARFLQGTADEDVDISVALRLLDHATGPDMRLTLVDGADHRFSDASCLALIEASVEEVLAAGEGTP